MIPHRPKLLGLPLSERFFLVDQLGLDITMIAGAREDVLRNKEDSTVYI